MIQVEHLQKQFGDAVAVQDLSFQAQDGAITVLLGSNGAGKPTTMRMISGVLKPQRGRIRIDDTSAVANPSVAQRTIGSVLDPIGLCPRLTARENIASYGQLRG